ncbi:MAG TPA: DUF2283 domain-containing protein [Vicinamibacterales bacterium]|nr:DUF2283 domain-containing protein [Vicinamibacterales bacterium]
MRLPRLMIPSKRSCLWRRATSGESAPRPHALFCEYDRSADFLLARFGDPEPADTIVIEPGIAVRLSRATHQPIGIEIADCAARFRKDPSTINQAFARELLARYGAAAELRFREAASRGSATPEPARHTP